MRKSLRAKKAISDICRVVANQAYLLGYNDVTDAVYCTVKKSTGSVDNQVERLMYWETLRSTTPFIFR